MLLFAAAVLPLAVLAPAGSRAVRPLPHSAPRAHILPAMPAAFLLAVRVFPAKAYAFVNYADVGAALKAMQAVDGLAIPQLTGVYWVTNCRSIS